MKFQAKISYMETHCTLNTEIQGVLEQTSRTGKFKIKTQIITETGSGMHYNF